MSYRSFARLSVLTIAVAAACAEQTPLAPPSGGAAAQHVASANTLVPLRGKVSGLPDASIPRAVCVSPAASSTPLRLEGIFAHLGLVSAAAALCNTVTGLAFPTVFVSQTGNLTVTAANGDLIHYSLVGTVQVNLDCTALTMISQTLEVIGGTGRFSGGSGSATFTGTQVPSACPASSDPPRLFATGTLDGVISTVGSNGF